MQGYPAQAQESGPTQFGDPYGCPCGCGGSGGCDGAGTGYAGLPSEVTIAGRAVPLWALAVALVVGVGVAMTSRR
jgi:hypothetical protein